MLRSCFIYLLHRQLLLRLVLQGIRLLRYFRQKEAFLHLFLHSLLNHILDNIHRLGWNGNGTFNLSSCPWKKSNSPMFAHATMQSSSEVATEKMARHTFINCFNVKFSPLLKCSWVARVKWNTSSNSLRVRCHFWHCS